jgi:FHA domain
MTPMAVVRPLPGAGIVARAGNLLMVCADRGGVEELLALFTEVGSTGGDGGVAVRRLSGLLANDESGWFPACAVSGPTPDGGVAVLVYGQATADLVGGEGAVSLSGDQAITAVNRLVPGPVTSIRLQLPGAGAPDRRARLDSGVVTAAGLVLEADDAFPPAMTYEAGAAYGQAGAMPPPMSPPVPPPVMVPPLSPSMAPPPLSSPVSMPMPMPEPDFVPVPPPLPRRPASDGHEYPGGIATASARPPAGVLVLDDGSRYDLDLDYIVGREPQHDPDVISGAAHPLKITDADGVVSRRHARVSLVGWEVHVVDLGSSNGTYVEFPGDPQRHQLTAGLPLPLRPGAQVTIGRRWFRFEKAG